MLGHPLFSSILFLCPNIFQNSPWFLLTLHFWDLIIFLTHSRPLEVVNRGLSCGSRQDLKEIDYECSIAADALRYVLRQFCFGHILAATSQNRNCSFERKAIAKGYLWLSCSHILGIVTQDCTDTHANGHLPVINISYRGQGAP